MHACANACFNKLYKKFIDLSGYLIDDKRKFFLLKYNNSVSQGEIRCSRKGKKDQSDQSIAQLTKCF